MDGVSEERKSRTVMAVQEVEVTKQERHGIVVGVVVTDVKARPLMVSDLTQANMGGVAEVSFYARPHIASYLADDVYGWSRLMERRVGDEVQYFLVTEYPNAHIIDQCLGQFEVSNVF